MGENDLDDASLVKGNSASNGYYENPGTTTKHAPKWMVYYRDAGQIDKDKELNPAKASNETGKFRGNFEPKSYSEIIKDTYRDEKEFVIEKEIISHDKNKGVLKNRIK